MTTRTPSRSGRAHGRGFTLVELIAAAMIVAMIAGAVTLITYRLLRSRSAAGNSEAFARASVAADLIVRDLASAARDEDLSQVRVSISFGGDGPAAAARDQLLLRTLASRPARSSSPQNEGPVHTVQYRIDPEQDKPDATALWRRADPFPNTIMEGGGYAAPIAPGIVGLRFEATDGGVWTTSWDSDQLGYPHAVRVTVTATDSRGERTATVRRTVALDRTPMPIAVTDTSTTGATGSTGATGGGQ